MTANQPQGPTPNDPVNRPAPERPGWRAIGPLLLVVVIGLGLLLVQSQIDERLLIKARAQVQGRKYRDALSALATRHWVAWSENDETKYLKGLCEFSTGRPGDALGTWSLITPGTSFAADATLKAGEWLETQGELDLAEQTYRQAITPAGARSNEVRHALLQLLWQEGRLDEVRPLVRQNWQQQTRSLGPDASQTIANLRAHLSVDLEVFPVDHVRQKLSAAAAKNPQDIGVLIGLANIMTRSGQTPSANVIMQTLHQTKSDDPRVAHALFLYEMQQNHPERILSLLSKIKMNEMEPAALVQLASLLAARAGRLELQMQLLQNHLKTSPGDIRALEELAEALIQKGDKKAAAELRQKRAELDMARRTYGNLVASDFKANAEQMAELAARQGRWFEAIGFASIAARQEPKWQNQIAFYEKQLAESESRDQIWATIQELQGSLTKFNNPTDIVSNSINIPTFEDIARTKPLDFQFQSGRTAQHQLPETMSGGVALIDYNLDGLPDIYALQGGPFPFQSGQNATAGDRLFQNKGDGTFEDVTKVAGLPEARIGYSHGASVADVDNDGDSDLFITRYGSYSLYLNNSNGTFEDATAKWKLAGDRDWPTSSAFADFDNDGDLDLYVCHYVVWDTKNPRICGNENGGAISYCVPHLLPARADHLFRNDGGKFTDISDAAGITAADTEGRGLGVLAADFDDDGLVDIFVANDGTANFLFKNTGQMKFAESALASGVAANADGGYQAGMGVSCGDFNNDLKPDIIVTNFYGESSSYFENMGDGLFRERGSGIGLKEATRYKLGFGTTLADMNNDSLLDIVTANGHVNDVRPVIPYQMPAQLLLGTPTGRLFDAEAKAGPDFNRERLGRGLAVGDLNRDGLQDIVILSLDAPLSILINRPSNTKQNYLDIQLTGVESNCDGVGAKITAVFNQQKRRLARIGGGSYQSANSGQLHLGLNDAAQVDELKIEWPSGQVNTYKNIKANRTINIREGDPEIHEVVLNPAKTSAKP